MLSTKVVAVDCLSPTMHIGATLRAALNKFPVFFRIMRTAFFAIPEKRFTLHIMSLSFCVPALLVFPSPSNTSAPARNQSEHP